MIHKYLVCAKNQIYLQSKSIDSYNSIGKVIELYIPLREFWELEKDISNMNYMVSLDEPQSEITSFYKDILWKCGKYALKENDRLWLLENGKSRSKTSILS